VVCSSPPEEMSSLHQYIGVLTRVIDAAKFVGMTQFRFFLTNMAATVVDVAAESLVELGETMERRRFLIGTAVDAYGSGPDCGVIISTSGIRMVSEVEL
jgi:hypothetical protein